jgi:hypothetical protein
VPLTLNPSAVNVLTGNPGLTFSDAHVALLNRGTLVLSTGSGHGCITHLRYGDNDKDLDYITLEDAGTTKSYSSADIKNLADFAGRLQEAANFGHRVTFCINTEEKRMFMLNIFPCGCPCCKCKQD